MQQICIKDIFWSYFTVMVGQFSVPPVCEAKEEGTTVLRGKFELFRKSEGGH